MKNILRNLLALVALTFGYGAQAQTYCTTNLYTTGCTVGDQIDGFSVGSFTSTTSSGCSAGNFGNYTTSTITLAQGSVNLATVTHGPIYSQGAAIWIDFNNDGDFTDAGEHIWSSPGWSLVNTGNITIPLTAPLGNHRLRVRCNYNATVASTDPCTTFIYGEAEDYTVNITLPPPCPPPIYLAATSITSTSAIINFTSTGNKFPIEWGPVGFIQGTGLIDTITASGQLLSGLPTNSLIDVYIQRDCQAQSNGVSSWSGPLRFKTLCTPFSEGYFENFDDTSSASSFSCWYDFYVGGTWPHTVAAQAPFTWGNVTAYSLPNVLYWYNGAATNSYVVTPDLNGLDGDTSQIRFRLTHNYFTNTPPLNVWVGTMSDRNNPATIVWHDTVSPSQYTWTEFTIMLTNVPAGHQFVVFGRGNIPSYSEVNMDNFYFESIPACPPVVNANAAATSATTAAVAWASPGTLFSIEYGGTGFIQGTGTTLSNITAGSVSLTGLAPNTCYDVYITRDCGLLGVSPIVGPITFCTPCVASSMPNTEAFSTWPPSCFQLSSTSNWNWQHDPAGYAFAPFWNNGSGAATLKSGPILINQKAQVSFKWAHMHQMWSPNDQLILMAHVLGSSQWDTLINLIGPNFNSPNANFASPPPSAADFISELFYLDSATYVGQQAEFQFVGITGWGPHAYIDDFVVEAVPPCPPPAQISITNIQGFQATINWNSIGGSSFEIEYGPQGFGQGSGTVVPASASPTVLSGLTPVTCYSVYVRTLCSPNDSSTWTGPVNFCTLVSCPKPTNISASAITTTSATINWTGGGAANWNYIIGPAGTTPSAAFVQTATKPITISTLMPSNAYVVWVRDSCGPGDVSAWEGPYNFATLCNSFTLNYQENFSTWSPPLDPTCWNSQGGTNQALLYAQGTNNMVRFNFWNWFSPATAYMTTPAVTISQKARLKFSWSRAGSTFYNDAVTILAKKTTSINWDTLATWQNPDCLCGAFNTTPGTLVDSIIQLDSNYVGSDIQVRFIGISDFGPDFFLDNVNIEVDPAFASCPPPTALSATNVGLNSATLGWTSTGASHQISHGTGTFSAANGTKIITAANPYTLTGLLPNTNYGFYVRDICTPGDTSAWSGPFSFITPLCNPAQQCQYTINMFDSFGDGWNGFTVDVVVGGNVITTLGNSFTTGSSATETFSICDGVSATFVVSNAGFWPSEVSFNVVDYGANTVVTGANFTSASQGSTVGSPVVPQCASLCPVPQNIASTALTCNSAQINWTSAPTIIASGIIYGPAGFNPLVSGTVVFPATSGLTLGGLAFGGSYDVYLTDSCAAGTSTPQMHNLTLPNGPLPGVGYTATQTTTTATSATVVFDASGSTNYSSLLWDFGNGNTSAAPVTTWNFSMNQAYTVTLTLTGSCGTTDSIITINVTGIGLAEDELARSLNIYPNPNNGVFTVQFSVSATTNAKLTLLDAVGREVYAKKLTRVEGEQTVAMDLANLAAGVYMLQLQTDAGTVTKRVTVRK